MSKIALGTVQFGIDYGINSENGQVRPEEVRCILNYAHSKDIDLLDTAPAYGSSEKVLGGANVQNFKVVTKTRHFDNAESYYESAISIPLFHAMTFEQQDQVIVALEKVLK